MEHATQEFTISYLGIIISTVTSFIIGGLWYSPVLFGKQWMKFNNFDEKDLKKGTTKIFVTSFLLQLLAAIILAAFLGESGWLFSLAAGLMIGIGWVGAAMGTTYLFERKPFKLWLINAGYHIIVFTIMSAIIGAFQA